MTHQNSCQGILGGFRRTSVNLYTDRAILLVSVYSVWLRKRRGRFNRLSSRQSPPPRKPGGEFGHRAAPGQRRLPLGGDGALSCPSRVFERVVRFKSKGRRRLFERRTADGDTGACGRR